MKKLMFFGAALLGALATPALASGWRFVDGEAVWGYSSLTEGHKAPSPGQRERVDVERAPVTASSWKWVGGEAGWIYVGPVAERRASTARASAPPSSATR